MGAFIMGLSLVLLYQYQKYRVAPTVDIFKLSYIDTAGRPFNLESLKGKKIIYSFFGTWCGECVMELKQLNETKHKNNLPDVEVVVVSDESLEKIKGFAQRKNYPFTFLKIDKPFSDLGVNAIPVNYLINAAGEVTYSKVGALNWKDNSVISLAEAAMKQ